MLSSKSKSNVLKFTHKNKNKFRNATKYLMVIIYHNTSEQQNEKLLKLFKRSL